MRAATRPHRQHDEDESIFVSMTDMTVSFLFILMVMLAFFASQFTDDEQVPKEDFDRVQAKLVNTQTNLALTRDRLSAAEAQLATAQQELALSQEKLQVAEASISSLENEVQQLLQQLSIAQARASELDTINQLQTQELQALQAKINELLATLEQKRQQINEQKAYINAIEQQLAKKDRLISDLLRQLGANRQALQSTFRGFDNFTSQLQHDLAVARTAQKKLQQRLSEVLEELAQARQELDKLKLLIAQFQQQEANALALYLNSLANARRDLITILYNHIRTSFPDLIVEVSPNQDALRFKGDDLFASGEWEIPTGTRTHLIIEAIGTGLDEILPCFSFGANSTPSVACNPYSAVVDAVQIEGHTDFVGREEDNLRLSLNRSAETYRVIKKTVPWIDEYRNVEMQPVLSVSGYGELRPLRAGRSESDKSANRRIDLRFLMNTPTSIEEVNRLKQQIQDRADEATGSG